MAEEVDLSEEDIEALWLEVPEEKRHEKEISWIGLPDDQIRYRKKMSVLARLRNQEVDPETGLAKFGGPQPGSGRPKKKRVAQMIAEKAQSPDGSKKIIDRLWEKLDSEDDRVSLRAVESIVRTEAKEEELQQKEQELDDKPRDQLIALLAPALARLQAAGTLDLAELLGGKSAAEVVEGTIVEDGDGREDGVGAPQAP